jgi:fibronectin type 3 domain-containing protein
LVVAFLVAGSFTLKAQSYLDTITFGNTSSERGHSFVGPNTIIITNTGVSPVQVGRCGLAGTTNDVYGGSLTVTMTVDPVWRNYFTLKLWGGDGISDLGRLYLYVPVSNYVAGATNNYQIGYRHEGDYAPLAVTPWDQPLPGRFFYSTTLLPLWMTQGRTNLTLQIVTAGRYYAFGSGGPPSGNLQFALTINSRSIYAAYTHTQPNFAPTGEVQGSKPVTATRPSPTVSVLQPGGTFSNGVVNLLNGRLTTTVNTANFSPSDGELLAHSYSITNLFTYTNPAVVAQVMAVIDCYATNYFANPNNNSGSWGGNDGAIGQAIWELQPQLASSFDVVQDYGAGGSITRRSAWGQMLVASRDYGRFNRNSLSNQGLICNQGIYLANKGLLALNDTNAFSEINAQRYLKEACGLAPWLGSDLAGGGSAAPYGTNYFQVTAKGQTREWGYVGTDYGEMQGYAADFYRYTGNPIFLNQAVKMVKARVPFRRPTMEVSGSSYYRTVEGIGMLAWRGADESDCDYLSHVAYGDRTDFSGGMHLAAVTQDPDVIGYAKQVLADNQCFNNLTYSSAYYQLNVFQDYQTVASAPDNGTRLPMMDGQPDFAWADEDNGVVAAKHGSERLWLSAYWEAGWGTGINGIGRFHYSRTNYDCYGTLETSPQINFSGNFFIRPNMLDLPYKTDYWPPDNPINAYAGERLPLGASDPGATDDSVFRGKARFWACRYANFLIGINRDQAKSFELKTPPGFTSAMNLVSGQMMSGTVMVSPRSTVVLYLDSATDNSPAPKPPLCLNAVASSTPKVTRDWNPSSGSLGYNVKRSQASGGPYTTIANVTGTNYLDTSVASGMVYYYVVAGTNTFGEGQYNSMEASATAMPLAGISVNFQGGSSANGTPSAMAATEYAGAAALNNWNNAGATTSGTVASLKQNDGTTTTASVTWSCNDLWSTPITESPGDYRMMKGYLDTSQSSTTVVTVTNLPSAYTNNGYSVYVYFDGDNGSSQKVGRYSVGTMTNWPSDGGNANFSGTFNQAWDTVGNYLVFGNLTSSGFTLQASGWPLNSSGVRAPVNAIQVVLNPLAAPDGLTAVAGNAQVTLIWYAVGGATSYNVKRSTTSGSGYVTVTNVTGASFVDTGLTNGTTYYYVVSAVNAVRESTNSTQVSTTPALSAPAIPTGLTVTASNLQVTLTWNAVLDATNYIVKSSTNSVDYGIVTNVTGTSVVITGLASGTTYSFVVLAQNGAGTSNNSTSVTPPAAPTGLIAYRGNAQAALNWNVVSNATAYKIKRSTTSGSSYALITSTAGTDVVDAGLSNGITYYYVVSALNGNGESINSAQIKVTPLAAPNAGVAISIDFDGGGNSWTATTMGKTEQAGVVVATNWNNAATKSGTVNSLGQSDGATTTASVTWSGNNTWNTANADVAGDDRMMKGYLDLSPNGSPTNATVTVTNLPAAYTNNGYSVYVYYDGDSGSDRIGIYNIGTVTNYPTKLGGINFSGEYVQANNSAGNYMVFNNLTVRGFTLIANGNPSDGTSGRAPINGIQVVANIFSAPTNLTATAGDSQVALSWYVVSNAARYNVKRWSVSASDYVTVTNVAGTNAVNAGLTNGVTYFYVVSATNSSGESAYSTEASATPLPAVPATPATVNATAGDTQVALSWSAVSNATGYNVKSSLTNGGTYAVIRTNLNSLTFTNTGLVNGTTYYYVVSALNLGGESTNSVQASALPVSLVPPQLQIGLNAGQLQFTWPADRIGWRLVAQTNRVSVGLTTNWFTVSNSSATNQMFVPAVTTNGAVFFRLTYP